VAKTNLSAYNNSWYKPGAGLLKQALWYFINATVLKSAMPFSSVRKRWLKLFGAQIGKGVVIKPHVSVKYPWNLEIGDYSWIGEHVWIDNLDTVRIGSNVCISQGAFILSGNHNYKKPGFDLMVKPIAIENGAWIGARSIVCQGIIVGEHAVLQVNSVATSDLNAYGIYQGNPAVYIKQRKLEP